jgi:hypothetical protein
MAAIERQSIRNIKINPNLNSILDNGLSKIAYHNNIKTVVKCLPWIHPIK